MAAARVPGPLLQAIEAVTTWLREAQVPAALIGGVAASLLGRPRVTKDVGLVALAEDGDLRRLLTLGLQHGIRQRAEDAIDFAKVSRVLLLEHEPSSIAIDLSLASLPFEREVIERAVERTIRGVAFRVATAEDLVVMKAIALRPRDVADIEALLDTYPNLDFERSLFPSSFHRSSRSRRLRGGVRAPPRAEPASEATRPPSNAKLPNSFHHCYAP